MSQTDRLPARATRSCRRIPQAQMPAIRRLVRQCCNFDNGYCLALDEGDGCACIQSYSCSLLCKWFREAVLPLDPVLEASLLGGTMKQCAICGEAFVPGSNRAKYCPACSKEHRRKADVERHRRKNDPSNKQQRLSLSDNLPIQNAVRAYRGPFFSPAGRRMGKDTPSSEIGVLTAERRNENE